MSGGGGGGDKSFQIDDDDDDAVVDSTVVGQAEEDLEQTLLSNSIAAWASSEYNVSIANDIIYFFITPNGNSEDHVNEMFIRLDNYLTNNVKSALSCSAFFIQRDGHKIEFVRHYLTGECSITSMQFKCIRQAQHCRSRDLAKICNISKPHGDESCNCVLCILYEKFKPHHSILCDCDDCLTRLDIFTVDLTKMLSPLLPIIPIYSDYRNCNASDCKRCLLELIRTSITFPVFHSEKPLDGCYLIAYLPLKSITQTMINNLKIEIEEVIDTLAHPFLRQLMVNVTTTGGVVMKLVTNPATKGRLRLSDEYDEIGQIGFYSMYTNQPLTSVETHTNVIPIRVTVSSLVTATQKAFQDACNCSACIDDDDDWRGAGPSLDSLEKAIPDLNQVDSPLVTTRIKRDASLILPIPLRNDSLSSLRATNYAYFPSDIVVKLTKALREADIPAVHFETVKKTIICIFHTVKEPGHILHCPIRSRLLEQIERMLLSDPQLLNLFGGGGEFKYMSRAHFLKDEKSGYRGTQQKWLYQNLVFSVPLRKHYSWKLTVRIYPRPDDWPSSSSRQPNRCPDCINPQPAFCESAVAYVAQEYWRKKLAKYSHSTYVPNGKMCNLIFPLDGGGGDDGATPPPQSDVGMSRTLVHHLVSFFDHLMRFHSRLFLKGMVDLNFDWIEHYQETKPYTIVGRTGDFTVVVGFSKYNRLITGAQVYNGPYRWKGTFLPDTKSVIYQEPVWDPDDAKPYTEYMDFEDPTIPAAVKANVKKKWEIKNLELVLNCRNDQGWLNRSLIMLASMRFVQPEWTYQQQMKASLNIATVGIAHYLRINAIEATAIRPEPCVEVICASRPSQRCLNNLMCLLRNGLVYDCIAELRGVCGIQYRILDNVNNVFSLGVALGVNFSLYDSKVPCLFRWMPRKRRKNRIKLLPEIRFVFCLGKLNNPMTRLKEPPTDACDCPFCEVVDRVIPLPHKIADVICPDFFNTTTDVFIARIPIQKPCKYKNCRGHDIDSMGRSLPWYDINSMGRSLPWCKTGASDSVDTNYFTNIQEKYHEFTQRRQCVERNPTSTRLAKVDAKIQQRAVRKMRAVHCVRMANQVINDHHELKGLLSKSVVLDVIKRTADNENIFAACKRRFAVLSEKSDYYLSDYEVEARLSDMSPSSSDSSDDDIGDGSTRLQKRQLNEGGDDGDDHNSKKHNAAAANYSYIL